MASLAVGLVALAFASPHIARAQDATTAKAAAPAAGAPASPVIVVIDPDRIRRESAAGKAVDIDLEKYGRAFDDENRKEEGGLQAAAQELDKDQKTLTKDQIDERRHAIAIKAEEIRQSEIKRRQAFDKSANLAGQKLYQGMLESSRDIASAHNADIVMRSQALLFFNTQLDVTNEVIDLMNKRLPKVEFPPPKIEADAPAGGPAAAPTDQPKPTAKAKEKEKPPQQQQ
jgi:Skp family chaperone for outer membrane proteins